MAKVDLTKKVYSVEGKPMKKNMTGRESEEELAKKDDLTVRDILIASAMNEAPDEKLTPTEKTEFFLLGMRFTDESKNDAELKNEEATKLAKRVCSFYNTVVFGQVNALLEGKKNPLEPSGK